MPKPSTPLLEVKCPCCEAILRVDVDTGAVITHEEKVRASHVEDLNVAVARIKKEESERDAKFAKAMAAEKANKDILNRKFDELFKKAKEDPDQGPPARPFDLD
ncbi:MAG: hypothetical protein ABI972_14745 [Acidobacteriota bacterium]